MKKKSEEYIKRVWIPMLKPGEFIKRVDENGRPAFFFVTKQPQFKKFTGFHSGVELEGIWMARPTHLFNDGVFECGRPNKCTIVVMDTSEIHHSTYNEMLDVFRQESEQELLDMKEKVKTLKKNIRTSKINLSHLDANLSNNYNETLSLMKSII